MQTQLSMVRVVLRKLARLGLKKLTRVELEELTKVGLEELTKVVAGDHMALEMMHALISARKVDKLMYKVLAMEVLKLLLFCLVEL